MKTKSRGNGTGCAIRSGGKWKAIATVGYIDGKAVRRTKAGFLTKAEALAYIPILKKEKREKKAPLTLIRAFDEMMKNHKVGKSTENCYKAGFALFADLYPLTFDLIEIDELQACLDDSELGVKTKQNARTALGLVYKYAIPRGLTPDGINLATFLKVGKGEKPNKRAFTSDELKKIRDAAEKDEVAAAVLCNCFLGFRPTAFLELKFSDYNKTEKAFIGGIKTEAGIDRTVTVSPEIQRFVNAALLRCRRGYVFGNNGKRKTIKAYRAEFYDLLERLGIQDRNVHDLTPHSCRHTFATMMKRVEAPERDKLELIGHTSGEMLRYYQDVSFGDLRAVTDKIKIEG